MPSNSSDILEISPSNLFLIRGFIAWSSTASIFFGLMTSLIPMVILLFMLQLRQLVDLYAVPSSKICGANNAQFQQIAVTFGVVAVSFYYSHIDYAGTDRFRNRIVNLVKEMKKHNRIIGGIGSRRSILKTLVYNILYIALVFLPYYYAIATAVDVLA